MGEKRGPSTRLQLPPAKRQHSCNPSVLNHADHDIAGNPGPVSEARTLTHDDYTVGWICALPVEAAASEGMFDVIHPDLLQEENDTNGYTLGRVGGHNVVLVCLPSGGTGTNYVANAATHMKRSFPKLRFGLMVGVGGGAPGPPSEDAGEDIRLGDVVVSDPNGECGGVIQYDFGKTIAAGKFIQQSFLNKPPAVLRSAVAKLKTLHYREGSGISRYVSSMLRSRPHMVPKFQHPGLKHDVLFEASYDHTPRGVTGCGGCDSGRIIQRRTRDTTDPVIHYGVIGSANQVMRHGATRETLRLERNIKCFEMEAAGLMDSFPCLVIRGICDYSDTHKNKRWQPYAAVTAAACAKELLGVISALHVKATPEVREVHNPVPSVSETLELLKNGSLRQEELEMLDWLAPPIYKAQYSDHLHKRQEGTGRWFLESPQFVSWVKGSRPTLFCPGIPGAGKTIIVAIAIEHLLLTKIRSGCQVAFIFCSYGMRGEQSTESLLATILRQLVEQSPSIPGVVAALCNTHKATRTRPCLQDLIATLHHVIRDRGRLFLIADALDECPDGTWRSLITSLRTLQADVGLSLMVTSRPNEARDGEFSGDIHLRIRAREGDIEMSLRQQIEGLSDCVRTDDALRKFVGKGISHTVDGVFLLAKLHLESLKGKRTRGHVVEALEKIQTQAQQPGALQAAYANAIDTIERQQMDDRKWATTVISWVVYAGRPLKTEELQHALAVKIDDHQLCENYIPLRTLHEILSLCAGLVTLNQERNTVELVHYTAQEYFEKPEKQPEWLRTAPIMIANTCLKYLSFEDLITEPAPDEEKLQEMMSRYSLLEYAALYWGRHCHGFQMELESSAKQFLLSSPRLRCAGQIMNNARWHRYGGFGYTEPAPTGLHIAGAFGLDVLVQSLIDGGAHVNSQDSHGRTPLFWAARDGHASVARILLRTKGINPDAADDYDCTPLSCAAENGHEEVVRVILQSRRYNPNSQDMLGRTTLHWAAQNGHIGIIQLLIHACRMNISLSKPVTGGLLEHGARIHLNARDGSNDTPLHRAVEHCAVTAIECLLSIDGIDLNVKNQYGLTPLALASQNGYERVVHLLLERGEVDLNAQDVKGQTALAIAAGRGHSGVVDALIQQRGVDINVQDKTGATALHRAIKMGHDSIVRRLLGADGIEVNSTDDHNRTPLALAALYMRTGILRLLLQMKGIDPHTHGSSSHSLLHYAIHHEFEDPGSSDNSPARLRQSGPRSKSARLDMSEGMPDMESSLESRYDATSLVLAVCYRCVYCMDAFLPLEDGELNNPDDNGDTPLHCAINRNYEELVIKLLQTPGIDVNVRDRCGMTPLALAAKHGRTGILALLRDTRGVDPNIPDHVGVTPLHRGFDDNNEGVVVKLLQIDGIDPNHCDPHGDTPLHRAVQQNYLWIVAKLLQIPSIDLEQRNKGLHTPLELALARKANDIVRLLTEKQELMGLVLLPEGPTAKVRGHRQLEGRTECL